MRSAVRQKLVFGQRVPVERNDGFQSVAENRIGHGDHGRKAGEAIEAEIQKINTGASCHNLNQLIDTEANRILDEYRAEDVRYDASTDHGRTQGAVLQ